MTNIGECIKTAREIKHISRLSLSERTGVSRATITSIENGYRDGGYKTVEKLLTALGYEIEIKLK